jgi:hypothetical protein
VQAVLSLAANNVKYFSSIIESPLLPQYLRAYPDLILDDAYDRPFPGEDQRGSGSIGEDIGGTRYEFRRRRAGRLGECQGSCKG